MGVWRRRRKKWCDITTSKTEKYRFEKKEKERELSSRSGSANTELGSFFCLNTAAGAMVPLPATPEERPRMGSWPNIYSGQNSCFPRTGMSKLFHGPKSQQIQCKSESSNSQYEERDSFKVTALLQSANKGRLSPCCARPTHTVSPSLLFRSFKNVFCWGGERQGLTLPWLASNFIFSSGWPRTPGLPASTSQMLGFKLCTTTFDQLGVLWIRNLSFTENEVA